VQHALRRLRRPIHRYIVLGVLNNDYDLMINLDILTPVR
jgi:hypothetical protein